VQSDDAKNINSLLCTYMFAVRYSVHLKVKVTGFKISVAEPHHFYAAPAPGENFDAAPAPAPAPTLLYNKAKFLKRTKVYTHVETFLFI
jgi:hypothetical protein